jgi:hypothetical protein
MHKFFVGEFANSIQLTESSQYSPAGPALGQILTKRAGKRTIRPTRSGNLNEDAAESGSRKDPQRSKAGRLAKLIGFFHFGTNVEAAAGCARASRPAPASSISRPLNPCRAVGYLNLIGRPNLGNTPVANNYRLAFDNTFAVHRDHLDIDECGYRSVRRN